MNITHISELIVGFGIGGIITVVVAYLLIKNDIQQYFRFKSFEASKNNKSTITPLRLQAYERLIIFIDRINPPNLLIRIHQPGIGLSALQAIALNEIKTEYQHNITQQLYIDAQSWNVVRQLKDDTIGMINNVVENLPETATGIDVSKKILQHMSSIEDNPYELAIEHLKKDIQKLF